MTHAASVLDLIGNTPLIRLRRLSEETGCTILGKAEFMNPGGSVKDRAALGIIRDAISSGALRPGGAVVEGTAGNTGIGLALVAKALGFRTVIVMPDRIAADVGGVRTTSFLTTKMFSPVPSATRPCGSSISASSKPLLIAIRFASTDVTYWPQILPLFITALPFERVKPEIMHLIPFLRPSSPRYAPHS